MCRDVSIRSEDGPTMQAAAISGCNQDGGDKPCFGKTQAEMRETGLSLMIVGGVLLACIALFEKCK